VITGGVMPPRLTSLVGLYPLAGGLREEREEIGLILLDSKGLQLQGFIAWTPNKKGN